MNLSESTISHLKTSGGAIFHILGSPQNALHNFRDFEVACSHLKLDHKSLVYGVELNPDGFTLYTKACSFRYIHDAYSNENRNIEFL